MKEKKELCWSDEEKKIEKERSTWRDLQKKGAKKRMCKERKDESGGRWEPSMNSRL